MKHPPPGELSHVGRQGEARMVDVSPKAPTLRVARAVGFVRMMRETQKAIASGKNPKGSVLEVARIAGIQGAKQTASLVPLCHPLPVENVRVDLSWADDSTDDSADEVRLQIEAEVTVTAKTGVEMEALTAVSVAALTVYDMAKAVDRGMVIEGVRLVEKTGGKTNFKSG